MVAAEMDIAGRLERLLEKGDRQVALISRTGCDLTRFRFDGEPPTYTHTGFALRDADGWRVLQMLNTHEGPEGHLYRQSVVDFFRDDPHEYRCGVLVPSPVLQRRLAEILNSPLAYELYTSRYNRVAYPLSTRYQNSNQWVAELLGAAQSSLGTRPQIQRFLAREGLRPSVLRRAGVLKQSVIGLVCRNTRFDDHPVRNRLAGKIAFVTETSIRRYLQRTDSVECEATIWTDPPAVPVGGLELRADVVYGC